MTMQGRGWRKEHLVVLKNLVTGEEVPVWTGLTPDPDYDDGRLISVIGVGEDGPTLRLGDNAGQLRINLLATADDEAAARRTGR